MTVIVAATKIDRAMPTLAMPMAATTAAREMRSDNAYPQLPKARLGRGHLFYKQVHFENSGAAAVRATRTLL